MNLLKGTKLYSIFTGTCPVCHKGKMYVESNPYKFSETLKMHDRCSHCDTKFKIEPSFFYGAMYVSYAVGVAIAVAAFIIAYFFIGLDRNYTFLAIIVTLVVTASNNCKDFQKYWINFFMKYYKSKGKSLKLIVF